MTERDSQHMTRALAIASQGRGCVEPNPMVGCVIADSKGVIAEGFHQRFGDNHAERNAIAAVEPDNVNRLASATLYVTLEPCCHHGKTPPCTDAVVQSGIRRVVVGMQDPFAKVAGGGIKILREAGISVEVAVDDGPSRRLNAAYLKRVEHGLPWVIAKWAMSLDGKIATRSGDSQWISGPESRRVVHKMRTQVDAIIVGSNTARLDDPLLTPRNVPSSGRTLVRVVVDSAAELSTASQLAQTARQTPTVVWAGPDANPEKINALENLGVIVPRTATPDRELRLKQLFPWLVANYTATNVLVEGGGALLGSLLSQHLIDQCEIFVGPKLLGGSAASSPIGGLGFDKLADSPAASDMTINQRGSDAHISCRLNWNAET